MASKFDPRPPDKGESVGRAYRETTGPAPKAGEGMDYLQLIGQAEDISKDDFSRRIQRAIGNSQRAWRNEHSHGSKYLDKVNFRGRSRLFVPKTRSAIRKNKAGAAAALFSTNDVISVGAEYDDDPAQLASASVLSQIMNYRLSRTNHKSGMPWFAIATAGRHLADVEGVTISKQYWDFHEEPTGETETFFTVNEETGVYEEVERPIMDIKRDRPMVELLAYENCYLDPAAPWYDPIQLGAWFIARYPMHLSDIRSMMKQKGKEGHGIPWRKVTDEELRLSSSDDQRAQQRRARESGVDRLEALSMPRDWDIVWINENFVRWDGKEECFWSAGRHVMLSDPIPTEEAYPEQYGMRPYVMGVSEIEPHVLSPMPPAESWQPLQLEINDVVNLRLDATKRAISPIAKVKRGRQVDYEQVRRRGQPEAMIILDDPEKDVMFEQTPAPPGQAYQEVAHANAMMDELAGQFSGSSVQTNRQLNETVGGMKMLGSGANATSEYDLRVWVETWVEPVLRQVINLIQWYESDEKIVALAGRKAQAWQKHGVNPSLDQLLEAEVTVKVNVGIGAQDPMQMLSKLNMALQLLLPLGEPMMSQGIQPNMEALIEEIMGRAGYKDGHRFFVFGEPPPPTAGADPAEMAKVEAQKEFNQGKLQLEQAKTAGQMQLKQAELQGNMALKAHETQAKMALQQRQQQVQTATELARMGIEADLAERQGMRDMTLQERQSLRDHSARSREAEMSDATERARIRATKEVGFAGADAKARSAGAKPNGKGASSPPLSAQAGGDGGQSALLSALVDRVEELAQAQAQGGDQGPSQGEQRMMMMMAQMLQMMTDAIEKMSGPKRVIRDPRTNEIVGVAPVENKPLALGPVR